MPTARNWKAFIARTLELFRDDGRVPVYMSPSDMFALFDVYADLRKTGRAEFISDHVRRLLNECDGLHVEKLGTGYRATVDGKKASFYE